jgi:hypothetical protein
MKPFYLGALEQPVHNVIVAHEIDRAILRCSLQAEFGRDGLKLFNEGKV